MVETDQNHRSKARFILVVVLGFMVISPIMFLVLFGLGQVRGIEFSPDDFSRRSFSYNQLPLVDWVIFKKSYDDITPDLEESLVTNKLINTVVNNTKTWHLVSESSMSVISHECDARFLIGFLDKTDSDLANYWDTWNTEHPECAIVFWPHVAELARDKMYLNIRKPMKVAINQEDDDPVEFDLRLRKTLGEVYLELGSLDLELGRMERARHRLNRAIEFSPTRESFLCRSKCLQELGLHAESKRDAQSAAALIKSSQGTSKDTK